MRVYDLADYRGKIVILEFMQTNCPHCSTAGDTLHAVSQKYGSKIQIVAVVSSQTEKDYTVASYARGHNVDYPILFDSGQMMYSYLRDPKIVFPHIYVIDPQGNIRQDYPYDVTTRDVFEGTALYGVIDGMLAEQGGKK